MTHDQALTDQCSTIAGSTLKAVLTDSRAKITDRATLEAMNKAIGMLACAVPGM